MSKKNPLHQKLQAIRLNYKQEPVQTVHSAKKSNWFLCAISFVTITLAFCTIAASALNSRLQKAVPETVASIPAPRKNISAMLSNLPSGSLRQVMQADAAANVGYIGSDEWIRQMTGEPDLDGDLVRAQGMDPAKIKLGNSSIAQRLAQGGGENSSKFTYDSEGRCVKIIETRDGSVTDTKQFVWCGDELCEERDASGAVTKQFFALGQRNGTTNNFYTKDHLGSVREMTLQDGTIAAQYAYGPFGEPIKLQGTGYSDFGYAGMYKHGPSGMNLTLNRAYSPSLGRWLSREPLALTGDTDYTFNFNNPINFVDRDGLLPGVPSHPWGVGGPVNPHDEDDNRKPGDRVYPDPNKTKRCPDDPRFVAGQNGIEDLKPTLDRIQTMRPSHRHLRDATTFNNYEGRLPAHPTGYYTEYVHPTPGVNGPGAKRIVTGAGGEIYYTPDHYGTFIRVK